MNRQDRGATAPPFETPGPHRNLIQVDAQEQKAGAISRANQTVLNHGCFPGEPPSRRHLPGRTPAFPGIARPRYSKRHL